MLEGSDVYCAVIKHLKDRVQSYTRNIGIYTPKFRGFKILQTLAEALLISHKFGSDMTIGTPPSARAECGFTAIGSRLFVFAGQTIWPGTSTLGEEKTHFLQFFVWFCSSILHLQL
jgi:hypothetical protein